MATHSIIVTVNGAQELIDVPSHMTLLRALRDKLALTGTKNGCEAGECGACTVLLDGEPVNSCMVLAVECDGREVTKAFVQLNAIQCGFCTPGVLMSAHALLKRNPHPTEEEAREAIVGNLCRCTGYLRISQAILAAAEKGSEE